MSTAVPHSLNGRSHIGPDYLRPFCKYGMGVDTFGTFFFLFPGMSGSCKEFRSGPGAFRAPISTWIRSPIRSRGPRDAQGVPKGVYGLSDPAEWP